MEEALKDDRFSHILTDPRFRKMPKNIRKVTVDKRFKGMFKDKKFKGKCMFDKRGKPLDLTPSENLKKLYEVSSESSEEDEDDEESKIESNSNLDKISQQKSVSLNEDSNDASPNKANKNKKSSEKRVNFSPNILDCTDEKHVEQKIKIKELNDTNSKAKVSVLDNKSNKKCKRTSEKQKLSLSDASSSEDEISRKKEKNRIKNNLKAKAAEVVSSEEEDLSSKIKQNKKDSSEESDDSDESESDDSSGDISEDFDHNWEELRNEAPDTDEITHRIAVCNMDWDRIRAEDLFACFDSFKPADSCIKSVKIYPSDYGLKRIEEEKINGPPELIEETIPSDIEEEPEDKKGSRYHREKLRQYQINRLKYYYAVVDCDTQGTANSLYEQLNGMEYESSSVRFDLRFIPDDVTFDQEPISVADKPPNPGEYRPRLFVTSALQQVKVNLTWDETDPKRRETLQKAFTEPDNIEKDIQDYLASSSSESNEEDQPFEEDACSNLKTKDRIAKYRELLLSLEEKEKEVENKYEMEITWEPGLREKTEDIVKEKMNKDVLNPFDEMVQKKKEERKLKRKELKAMQKQELDVDSSDSDEEFFITADKKNQETQKLAELALISDSKKKTDLGVELEKRNKKSKLLKGKNKPQADNFKMDVNDPRFSAIYSSHLYNIDPSDPHYKDTEGNRALIQEKQRKLKNTQFGRTGISKKAKYF